MDGWWALWVSGLVLAFAFAASAETAADADKLNVEVVRLYQAGKYAEAIPVAQRVLSIREKAMGPEHPEVGTSLNDLAELYRAQGRYDDAEPLYKRSLAIRERAGSPKTPAWERP